MDFTNLDASSDFDRLLFFEQARRVAEATYAKNPLDADNLTRWGGVLLELSQFVNGFESKQMLEDAIAKLEEALVIDPRKHDTLWCLGNAYTANAFFIPDIDEARPLFNKAAENFNQAYELAPQNELYKKSVEVSAKAPGLHVEIHKHGFPQQAMGPGPSASSTGSKQSTARKSKSNDIKYDIFGWVILAVGIVAWVGFAKSSMPAPPPPR